MHNRVTTTTLIHDLYAYQFRAWHPGAPSRGLLVRMTHDGHAYARGAFRWVNWS